MKKGKLLSICGCAIISAAMILGGCGASDTAKKPEATDASSSDNQVMETETDQDLTDEKSEEKEDAAIDVDIDEIEEEPEVIDMEWELGKVSGSEEDFEKYFNLDVTAYRENSDKPGSVTEISYPSTVIGSDRQAFVYTPYGYDESKEYPIIYLLHGIGCDGGQWTSMGACRMFDNMIAAGEIEPFVAVFPSVIPPGGVTKDTLSEENILAFTNFPEEWDKDLAPYIYENYAVSHDREKTAMCGLSMGGMETLDTTFRFLDRFNYIGSFSAAPTLDQSLLTLEGSEYTPALILVCSGDADNVVNDNPMNYHNTLTENGVDHIWYQHPGQGHTGTVWNLALLNFLKRIF